MENNEREQSANANALPVRPQGLQVNDTQGLPIDSTVPPEQQRPYEQQPLQQQAGPQFQQSVPPVQNIYITQQVQQAPGVMVAVAPKSVFVAFLLTFFFGPLGMFYSTVMGAIVMLVLSLVIIPLTVGIGALVTWPICVIWGCVAASQYNNRIGAQTMTQISR